MKLFFILLIWILNIGVSQNLVFFNHKEAIEFKKNELININGQKYRYQKAIKNRTQIHLLKPGFQRKKNITIDTSKIITFRMFKSRYSHKYAFKKALSGFKNGFICGGSLGLVSGLFWEGFTGAPKPSIGEKAAVGVFFGILFGSNLGVTGALIGMVNGFFSKGESKVYFSDNYKIKFDYSNSEILINPK